MKAIGNGRLFMRRAADSRSRADPDYATYRVDNPWLHASIGATTPCEFANPTTLMRLMTDPPGRLDLESGVIVHPTIKDVESF